MNRKRSHEPVVWLLFAAGGLMAAFVLPALIAITGILQPLGLLPGGSLDYDRVAGMLAHPVGKLTAFALISLLFWHALHRIFHGLHDLGIHRHLGFWRLATYGFALLVTLLIAGFLVSWHLS